MSPRECVLQKASGRTTDDADEEKSPQFLFFLCVHPRHPRFKLTILGHFAGARHPTVAQLKKEQ
jgi:hypothetical protein